MIKILLTACLVLISVGCEKIDVERHNRKIISDRFNERFGDCMYRVSQIDTEVNPSTIPNIIDKCVEYAKISLSISNPESFRSDDYTGGK